MFSTAEYSSFQVLLVLLEGLFAAVIVLNLIDTLLPFSA